MSGGTDAPRTLLAPLGVELLVAHSATVNPAYESGIFFTVRRIFLLGPVAVCGPDASVISTSDSLPMEESEENSISSPACSLSPAGPAIYFTGSPSGRGAGDQNPRTLACRDSELCHNPMGAVGKNIAKIEETTWN